MEIQIDIKNIFAEVFKTFPEKIDMKTKQNELEGWDSLGQLRLILILQEKYGISYSIEDIATLNSFEKILKITEQKLIDKNGY